jgi:hypothetical protein
VRRPAYSIRLQPSDFHAAPQFPHRPFELSAFSPTTSEARTSTFGVRRSPPPHGLLTSPAPPVPHRCINGGVIMESSWSHHGVLWQLQGCSVGLEGSFWPLAAQERLPMNLGSHETCRRFPLSPSEGERVGERGPPLPWGSGAQSASNCRGFLSPFATPVFRRLSVIVENRRTPVAEGAAGAAPADHIQADVGRIRTPPPWRMGERSARLLIGRTGSHTAPLCQISRRALRWQCPDVRLISFVGFGAGRDCTAG